MVPAHRSAGAALLNASRAGALLVGALFLAACAPEVGSDRWCEMMNDKPKGEWSANDAADYTKHCVLGMKPDAR